MVWIFNWFTWTNGRTDWIRLWTNRIVVLTPTHSFHQSDLRCVGICETISRIFWLWIAYDWSQWNEKMVWFSWRCGIWRCWFCCFSNDSDTTKVCFMLLTYKLNDYSREEVVDFTKRYMDYAVGILMKKKPAVSNLFSFLNPFHNTVWYSIIAGLVVVSGKIEKPGTDALLQHNDQIAIQRFRCKESYSIL